MTRIWRTIRGYIAWTHTRGSVHYDVMVTLILLFIFLAPIWINFKDKPIERVPHQTGVVVYPDGSGFVYQVDASAVRGSDDASIREDLLRVIEPISGEVDIDSYQAVRDAKGNITAYKVWVQK